MPRSESEAIEEARNMLPTVALCRLIETATREFDLGWVFYYQSQSFLEARENPLAGNAPIFVPKDGGSPVVISYHRRIEDSIDAFRACGNPNAYQIAEVELIGWSVGAKTVSAISLVCHASGLGLVDSKRIVEDCLERKTPTVKTADVPAAKALVEGLTSLGFSGRVRYEG